MMKIKFNTSPSSLDSARDSLKRAKRVERALECHGERSRTINLKSLKFDRQGLIPAIIQDYRTGEVLMLAYMNQRSLRRTLKLGKTCFWSRSRKEYWVKGKTSGNYQYVKSISYDCDMDALLIKVRQVGVACHTGNRTCFYRKLNDK